MRAIIVRQYGVPDAMQLEHVADPSPARGQLRIRLKNAGINPNETYVLTGTYAFYTPALPFTPGFDGAGIVEETGEGVTSFAPGDRVYVAGFMAAYCSGTYAEQVVVSAEAVHRLPDHVTFAQGAALGIPAAAAYRAVVLRGQVRPGDTVLIHGASGGVGLLAVQLAKAAGGRVIGTASSDVGRQLILSQGADAAIPHLTQDGQEELKRHTGEKGPDLIIEFLANRNLARDMEAVARYGRIVVVGNRGDIEINPRLLMAKESDIRGLGVPNYRPDEYREAFEQIGRHLEDGTLSPVIGRHFELKEAREAHQVILNQKTRGKLVFDL